MDEYEVSGNIPTLDLDAELAAEVAISDAESPDSGTKIPTGMTKRKKHKRKNKKKSNGSTVYNVRLKDSGEEKDMSMNDDIVSGRMGGGYGGGDGFMGGGLIGGLLLGALLRNGGNGLFGGNGDGGSAVNSLESTMNTNAILQGVADIKAGVPLAEAQVQLALAGAQADITGQNMQQTIALQNNLFAGQLANVAGFANTKDAVDSLSTQTAIGIGAIQQSIAQNGWAVTQAVNTDGDKTRSLINSINQDNLNRIITTQAAELAELRNEHGRANDRHGIEINMLNNQNTNQLQMQQQQQQLSMLTGELLNVGQIARATNQQLIIGNTGTTTGGAQSANPTNVRA